jgi:hypothetical protein
MTASKVEQRIYGVSAVQLFGICVTALGRMGARIERQDVERGTIVATVGDRLLAPVSELDLTLVAREPGQTQLVARWRARKLGGDRRILAAFLGSVGSLAARA